jgi:NAD(P)-dependent dehydrogenase (short-subunit alcohol dehydrogenase family)
MMTAILGGRVAVVTGGGRDLGRVIALSLADAGADVAVIGRTAALLDETVAAVAARGRRAWAHVCDVTDDTAVTRTFEAIADAAGSVDVLVNNAAAPRLQRAVADMTRAEWDAAFATKVTGAMLCSREALRSMLPQAHGAIVNISGTTGKEGLAFVSAHSVAQAGLIALTQSLAKEVGRHGVRVNAVVPSAIEGEHLTRITAAHDDVAPSGDSPLLQRLVDGSPLGRLVRPDDVADAVVFLASDQSSAMTGRTLELLL